jgi:hypothetical protein
MQGLDSSDSNKNPYYDKVSIRSSVRLTNANNYWFMNAEQRKKNLYWYERIPLELAKMEAFDQFVAKARGYMRYSYLWKIWQFVIGAQVS